MEQEGSSLRKRSACHSTSLTLPFTVNFQRNARVLLFKIQYELFLHVLGAQGSGSMILAVCSGIVGTGLVAGQQLRFADFAATP